MSNIGSFGKDGQIALEAVIPPGPNPTIDPNEPASIPCSNPIECAILESMVARNRYAEWHCSVYSRTGDGSRKRIAGYTKGHLKAFLDGAPLAHPPPGAYLAGFKPSPPPTVVPGHIYQFPGEEA